MIYPHKSIEQKDSFLQHGFCMLVLISGHAQNRLRQFNWLPAKNECPDLSFSKIYQYIERSCIFWRPTAKNRIFWTPGATR